MNEQSKCVIGLGGRLGNFMFKLAAGTYYAKKYNKIPYIHIGHHPAFDKQHESYGKILKYPVYDGNLSSLTKVSEDEKFNFRELEYVDGDIRLDGCFESEKYFPDDDIVKDLYSIPDDIEIRIKSQFPDINEYVGISIRLGDYFYHSRLFLMPEISWYMNMYEKYFHGRKALIFSDDIDWCKNYFKHPDFIYYDNGHVGNDLYNIPDPFLNLYTMGLCHHHICSCSTWSWWGARVCEQADSINIFPDKRFTKSSGYMYDSYIPDRWIKEKARYTNED